MAARREPDQRELRVRWRRRGMGIEKLASEADLTCPNCGSEMHKGYQLSGEKRQKRAVCPECDYQEVRGSVAAHAAAISSSSKLPEFLESGDLAWEWAKKNMDLGSFDDEDNGDDGYRRAVEDYNKTNARTYANFARRVSEDGEITVYRIVLVPSVDDVNTRRLGKYWSKKAEGAGAYGRTPHSGSLIPVLIEAVIKASDIDWEHGFVSFMYYGEDQWEVAAKPNVPMKITAISPVDRTQFVESYKRIELDEPITGNSGPFTHDSGWTSASVIEAAPYDGWKDLKPGKLEAPLELEDSEELWASIAERIGHNIEKGVQMRAPIIGGRRRYHHRPLRSYHLSNDRTLTITTDELEAKTWNNLKDKRHPAMPRIYDVFSVKKKKESKAKLWAIVHEPLVWPVPADWDLFVDSFFKWRAMEREALSPAKATDLEGFLRWVIDPEQADPQTTQKNRIEVVLPWKMTRTRRDDIADRRKKLFALPDLEGMISWAKSALKYLKQNKVKFRDFDPSNLAMTKKGNRVVITNLAESRSAPSKTGRTGHIKGNLVFAREGDEAVNQKALHLYRELLNALPKIKAVEKRRNGGLKLNLSTVTDDSQLKNLSFIVHAGSDTAFEERRKTVIIGAPEAKYWTSLKNEATPEAEVEVFKTILSDPKKKSSVIHELIHFIDSQRFSFAKADRNYKSPEQDYKAYANHPIETNAYFQSALSHVIDDFKSNMALIEKDTGPGNPGSNDHQVAVWKLSDFVRLGFKNFFYSWLNQFKPPWSIVNEENKKKFRARVYQAYDRLSQRAKATLKELQNRKDPMVIEL